MASDSSRSTTPMVLTPDSTGSSPGSSTAAKKSRRQTAFYPNLNAGNKPQKPFSRSAAKRESVMALGSIEHLQYYFTKTGIASEKDSTKKGLVPAIGGANPIHITTERTPGDIPEILLPPTPATPQSIRPAFPPYVKTYETDPENLLPGVIDDLTAVSEAWEIDPAAKRTDLLSVGNSSNDERFDVLNVLQITTRAIRSVRNYVVSLPSESAGTIREQFRSKTLGPQPKSSSSPAVPPTLPDPLTLIRKSALEALSVLRELEERCRLPLSDDAYDAQSDGGGSRTGHSRVASPSGLSSDDVEDDVDADTSMAFSLVQVEGRYESVPVWEDEDASDESDDEKKEEKERWDERLVLGSGWLYKQDVKLEDLGKEKQVIGSYLDVVDEVLFNGKKSDSERGWERERKKHLERNKGSKAKRRRTSAGDAEGRGMGTFFSSGADVGKRRVSLPVTMMSSMTLSDEPQEMEDIKEEEEGHEEEAESEDSIDDDELPEWAKRHAFLDNELERVHCILSDLLPSHLQEALAPASPRETFLDSLSSGQLLCVAYNAGVRKSKKPWGYVNRDAIHDILALEREADSETKKKGWTFRRTDNLRLWAGALGLRYMLPIAMPSQAILGSSKPTSPLLVTRFNTTGIPPIPFDAKVVAGKTEGWESMLETVLLQWVNKVVEERRSQR